jgi:hypothetical protein
VGGRYFYKIDNNFLPLSGGTVSGDTLFQENLSGDTIFANSLFVNQISEITGETK